jgi:hypothetical protein
MVVLFVVLIISAVFMLVNINGDISSLSKNRHDVTHMAREIEEIQDVPIERTMVYKTDNRNATWAHTSKKSSVREILDTSDKNSRLQYKTDMVDNEHPLCGVMKKYFPEPHHTLRVCSKNWEFKSHFDCSHNRVICIYGTKRFLVFDMYDHPNELDILEYTKNMPIDKLKPFLQENGIHVRDNYLQPGDELYIKPKMYHRVESNDSSIIIGHAPPLEHMKVCSEKFSKIWPTQGKLCTNSRCIE